MKHFFLSRRWPLLLAVAVGGHFAAQAQNVGIGTTTPDASAALDIVSSSKGVLLPRVADVTAIATPAPGLILFQTGGTAGYYYNAGTSAAPVWKQLNVVGGPGDNLGNHAATQGLTGTGATIGTTVGLGIRADGGLNLGQNSANNNLYVGYRAGEANTATGADNLFIGHQAGKANTSGSTNFFIGSTAGFNNTTGNSNLAIGYLAGQNNQTGINNFQIGPQAGRANTASENHFVGFFAGTANTTGVRNTFEGNYAGVSNGSGSYNTALGFEVANSNTSGSSNTLVGFHAGQSNVTGSNNTALGYQAGPSSSALTNATAIGYNASVSQSNSLVLGNGANVGIGTSAPLVPLSVVPGGLGAKITLWDAGSTTQHYGFGISSNQLNYQVQGTADHVFSRGGKNNDGTEEMRLQGSTGNLGIGTPSPSALLDVNGSTRLRGLSTAGFVTTDASGNLTSSGTSGSSFINNTTTSQTANFNISGNGTVGGNETVAGTSTIAGLLTGTGGATVTGATNINTGSSTAATNIGTGASSGNVTIGRVGGGTFLTGPTTVAGNANINTGTGAAITNIGTGTGSGAVTIGRSGGTVTLPVLTTAGIVTTDASGNLGSATAASLDAGTASNGLTKTGQNVALGGALTAATTIAQAGNNFSLTGGNVGIGTTAPAYPLDVNGSIHATTGQGVVLDGQDRPLITRGWDAFSSGAYSGLGRWGVFMEPNNLTFGVPALGGKQFQWVTYTATSTISSTPMTLTQGGNLGIGASTPLAGLHVDTPESGSTTALGVIASGGTSGNPSLELRGSGKTPYLDFAETSGVDYTTRLSSSGGTLSVLHTGTNATLEVRGYTKLSGASTSAAPAIAYAKLTSTVPTTNNGSTTVVLPAGITGDKVLSLTGMVATPGSSAVISPPNTTDGTAYSLTIFNNIVYIVTGTSAANIFGQPIKILITYEQ